MSVPWVEWGAAFTLALFGGAHCVGMCGGIVGAFQLNRPAKLSAKRLAAGYHLGRISTYTLAGALMGGVGARLYATEVLPLQVILLVVGAVALLGVGVSMMAGSGRWRVLEPLGAGLWRRLAPLARKVLPPRSGRQAYVAGLIWGWIPCGMVYSALPLALVAGSAAGGASTMLAFGLGTLPAMLTLDVAVVSASHSGVWARYRGLLRPAAGALIALFGLSSLAHAAAVAGLRHPAVAALASLCGH
ncbi:MAG TPA: sulfite exporter TauE/SafE family protein [Burkholderiaceae bacterium]|nr:sulfite exporter TauE/SafE family protein [Burkholderiaceae bacterium]